MPELPEVETVVRTLRPRLLGASIRAVWTSGKGLRMARPVDRAALARLSVAARITAVRRKGKYILIDLGRAQAGILVHLGMTGRLRVQAAAEPRARTPTWCGRSPEDASCASWMRGGSAGSRPVATSIACPRWLGWGQMPWPS